MNALATLSVGGTRPPGAFLKTTATRRRAALPAPRPLAQLRIPTLCALVLIALGLFAGVAPAAEVLPPAPRDHFNDYAGLVATDTARALNDELAQLERATSNQILVAIYPRMQSNSSIEDYTVRLFQAWGVGQKDRKNGAVLFVFSQDRTVRIVTGYGLEGVLPDALCKQIIEHELTPRFRTGDYTGGAAAAVRAMIAATRGEYRGTGRTVADGRSGSGPLGIGGFGLVLFVIVALSLLRAASRRNVVYSRGGRRSIWINPGPPGGWGGGGSSGGGGSFSGGGGSTGGGGAGGRW